MDEGPMATALSSEDVLLLILSRVTDPLDLLRCAATCTRWFRLIATPPFPLWAPDKKPPSTFFLGYFPPCFSRLAGTDTTTSSFFHYEGDGVSFNYAMPLASRRGLLLLRIDGKDNKLHLAVCNPLIGRSSVRTIPPPPFFSGDPDLDVTGYALLTTADLRQKQQQPAFQVLLAVLEYQDNKTPQLLHAYSYSAWTGVWSHSAPIQVDRHLTPSGSRAGVIIVSPATSVAAHWLYMDWARFYTVHISLDNDDINASLTAIPWSVVAVIIGNPLPRPLLCHVSSPELRVQTLALITVVDSTLQELWLWTKNIDDDWMRRPNSLARRRIKLVGFAESRGVMLVEQGHRLLALDLQMMQMEMVMTCTNNTNRPWRFNASVLYEMDWSSFVFNVTAGFLSCHHDS